MRTLAILLTLLCAFPAAADEGCYTLATFVVPSLWRVDIDTPQNCSGGFTAGTVVALSAHAAPGVPFQEWTSTHCTLSSTNTRLTTCTITGTGNATATATYDMRPQVSVGASANPAEGGQGSFTIFANMAFEPVTVYYSISGTASAGADYPDLGTSVVVPLFSREVQIPVRPVDDGIPEGAESVELTITADPSYRVETPSSMTMWINDRVSAGMDFYTLPPCRVFDSRYEPRVWRFYNMATIQVSGRCGIPSTANAVALIVTTIGPPWAAAQGHVALFATGTPRAQPTFPYQGLRVLAYNMGVALSGAGQLDVYDGNAQTTPAHLLLDTTGYFQWATPPPP